MIGGRMTTCPRRERIIAVSKKLRDANLLSVTVSALLWSVSMRVNILLRMNRETWGVMHQPPRLRN